MLFLWRATSAFRLYSVAVTGCHKTMMNYSEESLKSSQNMGMLLYSVAKSPLCVCLLFVVL